MSKVACIGECMVELKQADGGLFSRGYGGDTLNTAVYLARLGVGADYITALGDDPLSDEMIAGWAAEGVGTKRVVRLPGKLPGLYMIQTDGKGERRFFHWRDSAAARSLMDLPQTPEILDALAGYDVIYLSAITLSLYGAEAGRGCSRRIGRAREAGARFAFDTNFRARGWPDLDVARAVFRDAFAAADIVLASTEDLLPLYPGESNENLLARIPGAEVVLKLSEPASILRLERRALSDQGQAGGGARRRYHGRRRQFCRRLRGGTPRGRGPARSRAGRASPGGRCGMSSRGDHPARGDAARPDPEPRQFSQGIAMTAAARQEQLAAIFRSATVIPVLTIERLEDAVPLARALVAGGVRVLEVTLRTPVAVEAAKAMIAEVPDAIVGIGTILNADDLARASALGAKFGISPGATPELLKAAAASDLPFAPGIATASELMQALAAGFDLVKFFPAEQAGGIKALRALAGPFPNIRVCPTGGIGEANAASLAGRAECGGGGRFLALPGRRYQVRQLGRHNRHVRADDEIAESVQPR